MDGLLIMKYKLFKWYKLPEKQSWGWGYYYFMGEEAFESQGHKTMLMMGWKFAKNEKEDKSSRNIVYHTQLSEHTHPLIPATAEEVKFLNSKVTSRIRRMTIREKFGEDLGYKEWFKR